jgi:hypothetical protein
MISTAFLTDYNKRLYATGAPHNHLKLFCGLVPGSEIITAEYFDTPDDFNNSWFNYRYLQDTREFIHNPADIEFKKLAEKINSFLPLWTSVINKLNFVYKRECSPFKFEEPIDPTLITVLQSVSQRCEDIIIVNYKNNNYSKAVYDIGRVTFLNIFL